MEARDDHERYENGALSHDTDIPLIVAAMQRFFNIESEQDEN